MAIFGRKRREETKEMPEIPAELPSLNLLDQIPAPMNVEPPKPKVEKHRDSDKVTVAPLFVKMDKYRQILTTIGNLKTALMIVNNSLSTLHQIEKVRDQTFDIITDIANKMDDKLIELDNNLLRPAGYKGMDESLEEQQDIRGIEATVADLQGQISQLKNELGKMI